VVWVAVAATAKGIISTSVTAAQAAYSYHSVAGRALLEGMIVE
jgi:hypothetical protein